jgi:hypothetical protein
MSLTTMLLIKIVVGLTAMALACAICIATEKVAAAGRKALASVNGYCRAHFHHAQG